MFTISLCFAFVSSSIRNFTCLRSINFPDFNFFENSSLVKESRCTHSISASSVAFFEYFQEYISSHLGLCFQCSTHLSYTVSEISKWQSPNSLSAVAVVFVFVKMNKTKTKTTATVDKEFGDWHFDISESSKRLVRATLKTYERTGTYVFLKFF